MLFNFILIYKHFKINVIPYTNNMTYSININCKLILFKYTLYPICARKQILMNNFTE